MMREKMLVSLVLVAFFAGAGFAGQYYVSPTGNDANAGTEREPFRTIGRAADVMKAGDTCYIRGGSYHETVTMQSKNGTSGNPITFTSYQDETVTLDGTEAITYAWTQHSGKIYKTTLSEDIWQLFVDGKMMLSARWPNASLDDGSWWDQDGTWGWQASNSTYGHMYDEPHDNVSLAATNIDFTGAVAIMNIGSWRTFAQWVNSHTAGSDNFTYDPNLWTTLEKESFWDKKKHQGRYYLEGKLECLDTAKEWFYKPGTKVLYLWSDDGGNPTGRDIRGKTQSYALDARDCSYLVFKTLNFFATTFKFSNSTHMTVQDCRFSYPSYSKRMLGKLDTIDVTSIISRTDSPSSNIIRNCIFEYTDGTALKLKGLADTVENCLFHDIDFSCVGDNKRTDGFTLNAIRAKSLSFRRNTMHTTGGAEGYRAGGPASMVELNRFYNIGLLQSDGSAIQFGGALDQPGSVIRYNWSHDTAKNGIRFDGGGGPPNPPGTNGTIHHNMVWKTKKISVKGDYHQIYNNSSFENSTVDIVVLDWEKMNGINTHTITRNNAAGSIASRWWGSPPPVPGILSNNWLGDVKSQLCDPNNLDFRPKTGSELIDAGYVIPGITDGYLGSAPDIGAYESGDENYWIPGRKMPKASTPVPPNGSATVKPDADLMWLGGYKAASHDIYFGKDKRTVTGANRKSGQYRGNQANNIFEPGKLDAGRTYYWRIDAVDKSGVVTAGDVWSFTTEGL